MRHRRPSVILAGWDVDARVWVATSGEVPGLATEAFTIAGLHRKLTAMVPELLEANGCMPANGPVAIKLWAHPIS